MLTCFKPVKELHRIKELRVFFVCLCRKEDVEKCKQKDMLEQMIEEMTGEFPALGEAFVRERDIYLAHSLRRVAQPIPCPDAPEGSPTLLQLSSIMF